MSEGSAVKLIPEEYRSKYLRWRWIALLSFCILYLFMYTGRMHMGIVMPEIKEDLGLDYATVGLINSAFFWAYAFGQLLHGRLGEIFGSKRWCYIGAIGSVVLNWLIGYQSLAIIIAILWALNGLFQSMVWNQGMRIIANWWPRAERGLASGIALFFAGWATTVVWVTTYTALGMGGWRAVFKYPLLLLLAATILFIAINREKPQDVGLPPYTEYSPLDKKLVEMEAKEAELRRSLKPYIYVWRDRRFLLAAVIMGFASWARYILLTWIPSYYVENFGINLKAAVAVSLGLPVGMAIGAFTGGYISDKVFKARRTPAMATMYTGLLISTLVFWFLKPTDPTVATVLLFVVGFFAYGGHGPLWALCTDLGGRAYAGTVSGSLDFVAYIFAAVQSGLIGGVLTATGWWDVIFLLEALCGIVCIVVALVASRLKV